MRDRSTLRWLLRMLGDDAMLPLLFPDGESRPRPGLHNELERVFFSFAADLQHPEKTRQDAWTELASLVADAEDNVLSMIRSLIALLRDGRLTGHGDLARVWAWPELCDEAATCPTRHYELHAHFRGAIPFDHLWRGLLEDAWSRANLRHEQCEVGSWRRTRAELVEIAARLRPALVHDETLDESTLRTRCMDQDDPAATRYLILYANLRRSVLHQRGKQGLVRFTASYDRFGRLGKRAIRLGRAQADRASVVAILERFERSGTIAIELRPTLDNRRIDLQRKLQTLVLGYFDYLAKPRSETRQPIAMGLLPSLFKQEAVGEHAPVHGRSDDEGVRERLEAQQAAWNAQLESLLVILDEVPPLRLFIVGVDAAGRERGTPSRALRAAFDRIRGYNRAHHLLRPSGRVIPVAQLRAQLIRLSGGDPAQALWEELERGVGTLPRRIPRCHLGVTTHAGEDFVDPTTGLREIWDAIEHLKLAPGDRIGHALAASLDPERVQSLLGERAAAPEPRTVVAVGPRRWRLRKSHGVHLLDLAWSQQVLHDRGEDLRPAFVHAASHAFGVMPPPNALLQSLVGSDTPVRAWLTGVSFADPDRLEPELSCWIEVDDAWCVRFERLRQRVVERLIRSGIVVESCPTSNCAVASLDRPPIGSLLGNEDLRCVVATDDPGVFGAWPEHELTRLKLEQGDAAVERVLTEAARASFVRLAPKEGAFTKP